MLNKNIQKSLKILRNLKDKILIDVSNLLFYSQFNVETSM